MSRHDFEPARLIDCLMRVARGEMARILLENHPDLGPVETGVALIMASRLLSESVLAGMAASLPQNVRRDWLKDAAERFRREFGAPEMMEMLLAQLEDELDQAETAQ